VAGSFFQGANLVHAFIWSRTTGMEDLGVLVGGDNESVATGINESGEVTGYSTPYQGTSRAFRWSRESGMMLVPSLSYCIATRALDINAAGEIVGMCRIDQSGIFRPFRWTIAKGMEDLGTLDIDRGGAAMAINDSGLIAGFSNAASIYDDARGVIWSGPGRALQIGDCIDGWCGTEVHAINNNGDVTGTANGTAFIRFRDGTMRDIGKLRDATNSTGVGINEAGDVIGISYPPYSSSPIRSFIWTAGGGMRELGIAGKSEFVVTGINNKGEIVGYAR
jgi:probable HAF family extracellular repeat protein